MDFEPETHMLHCMPPRLREGNNKGAKVILHVHIYSQDLFVQNFKQVWRCEADSKVKNLFGERLSTTAA